MKLSKTKTIRSEMDKEGNRVRISQTTEKDYENEELRKELVEIADTLGSDLEYPLGWYDLEDHAIFALEELGTDIEERYRVWFDEESFDVAKVAKIKSAISSLIDEGWEIIEV